MEPETVKEVFVDGYKGIEGFIPGEKTRYSTVILKDNKLFSLSTISPTQENKAITDKIISTLSFE